MRRQGYKGAIVQGQYKEVVMAKHVTTEQATVFRGAERRYFSEGAAYRSVAKAALFKQYPCDCEADHPEIEGGHYGHVCELHRDRNLERRITILAQKMQQEDRDLGTGMSLYEANESES
jgi:hypothetical protein